MVTRGQFARLAAVCVLVVQAVLAPVAGAALASGRDTAGRAPSSPLAPGSAGVPPAPVPPGTAGILPAPIVSTGSARAYGDTPLHQPVSVVSTGSAGASPLTVLPAPVGWRAARGPGMVRSADLAAGSSQPPRRPAPPTLTLRLASTPAHPVALRIGQVVDTLSRPVGDGTITFSLRRPTATGALYSCAPVHGRCVMAWAAHNAGAIAAHWSGDRHYRSADATLTIAVSRAAYSDSGTWQGRRVGPLTRVAPAVNVPRLPGAARAGQLTRFHSDDPAYRCLDGKSRAVYIAPRAYPDDYVAYSVCKRTGGSRYSATLQEEQPSS